MIRVAITGGIGSGKSTACRMFKLLGTPVYCADIHAKLLWDSDPKLHELLESQFGKGFFDDEGYLIRSRLADLIFSNKQAMDTVNSWIHPAVARDFDRWCNLFAAPYVLHEAAILFETGMNVGFDRIIVVTAPEDVRIRRVCLRDSLTPEAVKARMASQWPDDRKVALADYVIYNDGETDLNEQVEKVHEDLLNIVEPRRNPTSNLDATRRRTST